MRIIMLDIDGVLNSTRSAIAYQEPLLRKMDPIAVKLLHMIVERSGAKIVVSSTWRYYPDWLTLIWGCLREAGWPAGGSKEMPLLDRTPRLDTYGKIRGDEIKAWLDETTYKVDSYIILDDDSDMLPEQEEHLIKCDPQVGLGLEQWEKICYKWPEVNDKRNN